MHISQALLILNAAKKGWSTQARVKSALVRKAKKKIVLKRVKPGSADYKKLTAPQKEKVLKAALKEIDKAGSVYRRVGTKGFKNLLNPKIEANKSIGRFEGMARAYRNRAAKLKGKKKRVYLHMALNCLEQAHELHNATKGRWPKRITNNVWSKEARLAAARARKSGKGKSNEDLRKHQDSVITAFLREQNSKHRPERLFRLEKLVNAISRKRYRAVFGVDPPKRIEFGTYKPDPESSHRKYKDVK